MFGLLGHTIAVDHFTLRGSKRSGDHKISHLVPNKSSAKSPSKFARCTSSGFLKTNLTKFAVILSEKASKGKFFFARSAPESH